MCEPRSAKGRLLGALFAVATAVVTVTIAVGVASAALAIPATSPAPHLSVSDVGGAWQFPVPHWSQANKE